MSTEIQIVSNEQGELTAVIVPIKLWHEIESERETAYLLQSGPRNANKTFCSRLFIEKLGI